MKGRQNPKTMVDPWRDIPRLLGYLEERKRADLSTGQRPRYRFTTAEINRALYPTYDKARTYPKQASPALLLLRAASQKGLCKYATPNGVWVDTRDQSSGSLGEALKRAGVS